MCQVEEVKEVCIDMYSVWSRIIESYTALSKLAYTYECTACICNIVLLVLCYQFQLLQVGVSTTSAIPNISLSWCICIECETV